MSEEPPAHIIDSRLFRDLYGTHAMRAVFSDRATLQAWFDAEAALAAAEAECGLIPQAAAGTIARAADAAKVDIDALRDDIARSGHPFVPAVKSLEKLAGDAGTSVHFGATTQDIMDTGAVLQMRAALALIEDGLEAFIAALARPGPRPSHNRHGRAHPWPACRAHNPWPQAGRAGGRDAPPP